MEIQELIKLARWYRSHFDRLGQLYQNVIAPVQHNASQAGKQPLEEPMAELIDYLSRMDFDALSLQQIKMLERRGIRPYLGHEGAAFIENTIKTSNYDPTTAVNSLNVAFSEMSSAKIQYDAYVDAIAGLKVTPDDNDDGGDGRITIRVEFQKDASINNMVDWKASAKAWHLIIYGLALAVDESVEDTHVVGATKGSIILVLNGTAAVTSLLAIISKALAEISKDIIGVRNTAEELRHKRQMNEIIEEQFKLMVEQKRQSAEQIVLADIQSRFPQIAGGTGDKVNALKTSIKNLLQFSEQGGNVDFVAPDGDQNGGDDDHESQTSKGIFTQEFARQAIHELQEVREQLRLSHQRGPVM